MNDLRIRFNDVSGDSAVVEIATRRCRLTVAELERSLVSLGLTIVRSEMWLSDQGCCQCLYVFDQHQAQLTRQRTADILATLLTALEPELWATPTRGDRKRRRERSRADYLT
jgi:hypothetical protein